MSAAMLNVWKRLQSDGLVQGELPTADEVIGTSWPIRILLGIAAWIAAIFMFGFFGLFVDDLLQEELVALGLGVVLCAVAGLLFRAGPSHGFMLQFGLAMALAGELCVWFGLFDLFGEHRVAAASATACVELALVALLPNFLHRILATIAAGAFAFWAVTHLGYPLFFEALLMGIFAFIWLNEARWFKRSALVEPVGIASALLLALAGIGFMRFDLFWLFGSTASPAQLWTAHFAKLLMGALFVFSVAALLRQNGFAWRARATCAALCGSVVLAFLCVRAPGLLPALLVLLLGFARGHRFILLLGLIALLGYGAHYYHALEYNLMVKAGVLALCGGALLGARFALAYLEPRHA